MSHPDSDLAAGSQETGLQHADTSAKDAYDFVQRYIPELKNAATNNTTTVFPEFTTDFLKKNLQVNKLQKAIDKVAQGDATFEKIQSPEGELEVSIQEHFDSPNEESQLAVIKDNNGLLARLTYGQIKGDDVLRVYRIEYKPPRPDGVLLVNVEYGEFSDKDNPNPQPDDWSRFSAIFMFDGSHDIGGTSLDIYDEKVSAHFRNSHYFMPDGSRKPGHRSSDDSDSRR